MRRKRKPSGAFIAITLRCNSRCVMCNIWKKKIKKEVKPEIFSKLPPGLTSIDITGGEPFLRNDLVEIVQIIKRRCPKAKLLITTNGLLIEKIKKTLPNLLKVDKNISFRVSLDGFGKLHGKIKGFPNAFKKARTTLKILKKYKVKDLGIIFTLMDLNKNILSKMLEFCKREKLNFSLNIVHDSPIYFGKKHIRLRPTIDDCRQNLIKTSKFFSRSINPKNWVKAWFYRETISYLKTSRRPIPCGAGENFFYMDSLGNIYMCHFKNYKIGNLKIKNFNQIWQGQKRKQFLAQTKLCNDCWMICSVKENIKKNKLKILRDVLF